MRLARLLCAGAVAVLFVAATPGSRALALTARQIMERVNARPRSATTVRRLALRMQRRDGVRLQWELIAYQSDDGSRTKRLFTMAAPPELRGLGVLKFEGNGADRQWLHLEGLREPVAVASDNLGQAFFGTEFTLSDIRERLRLDAYRFRLNGEVTLRGRPCYVVDGEVRDRRSHYGRIVAWIDRERWLILKAKYYDRQGRPLKMFQARRVESVDGYWTPHILAMRNVRTRAASTFEVLSIRNSPSIPSDLFTREALAAARGRCYPTPCGAR